MQITYATYINAIQQNRKYLKITRLDSNLSVTLGPETYTSDGSTSKVLTYTNIVGSANDVIPYTDLNKTIQYKLEFFN